MQKCGETIAFHRKRLNLTQTELGEQLNVTAQAVSKWENDISEPDLVTVQRLCKIFGITVDEFLNHAEGAAEKSAETATAAEAAMPAPVSPEPVVQKILVGYCDSCKRPLYEGDDYAVHHHSRSSRQTITCRACETKHDKNRRQYEYSHEKTMFTRGLICGGCVGGALAIGTVIAAIVTGEYLLLLLLVFAVAGFTFASSLFWSETVQDMFFFFLRSFRMPGVIFTLSLDGIIWLITVKLFLAIFAAIASVLCFLFGCIFTPLASIVLFPFSVTAESVKIKKLKKEAQR